MAVATMAPPVLVTPSVHYAILSDVSPLSGIRGTKEFADFLKRDFKGEEFADVVVSAAISGIDRGTRPKMVESAGLEATLLHAFKGRNSACVVYPTVALELPSGMVIEISAGTQIPTTRFMEGYHEGAPAINWASINVRCNYSDELKQTTIGFDELPKALEMHRRITERVSRREYDRVVKNLGEPPGYNSITEKGTLTSITLGVCDERLEQPFEAVADGTKLEKIFTLQNEQELLFTYLRAAGLDGQINMANARKRGKWFDTYAHVAKGFRRSVGTCEYSLHRTSALYFVTQKDKEVTVVGIGHDSSDGRYGWLAREASSRAVGFIHQNL